MKRRKRLLWLASALLLAGTGALTLHMRAQDECRERGGRWRWYAWHCEPGVPILLGRELQRA